MSFQPGSSKLMGKLHAKFFNTTIGTNMKTMYYLTDDKNIERFFNSKLIEFIVKITQYTNCQFAINDYKILNLITVPEGLKNNPTDKDIYDYYKLTKEEIKLIEEVTKSGESKKTKKVSIASKNNSSMKNNINNTNHNGGGIRSRKRGKRSKRNK